MLSEIDAQEEHPKSEPCGIDGLPPDMTLAQPPEILAEIFGLVLDTEIILPSIWGRAGYPWSLGHVCSRWRQILWEHDLIWSNIVVHYNCHKRNTEASSLFIQRLRESLLYVISNTAAPLDISFHDDNINPCVDIISAHSGRFRSVHSTHVSQETFGALLGLPPYSFKNLERLCIRIYVTDPSLIPATSTSALVTAPNLQNVDYDVVCAIYIPQYLLLPSERVTHIYIHSMPVPFSAIQTILVSSPCLVWCEFHSVFSGEEVASNRQAILHDLKTLKLYGTTPFDSNVFLAPLTTPALDDFLIWSPQFSIGPVASLIARSKCPVTLLSLGMSGGNFNTGDPIGVESLIDNIPPTIVYLDLSWLAVGSLFRKIREGMLPSLKRMNIPVNSEGLEAFAGLINSYIDGTIPWHQCLVCVEVYIISWDDESDIWERCMEWVGLWNTIMRLIIVLKDEESGVDLMLEESDEDDESGESTEDNMPILP